MLKLNILEKIAERINFKIFNRNNSRNTKNKSVTKNSNVETIQQADQITNNDFRKFAGADDHISDLEINILKELYLEHKKTNKYPRLKLRELHKKLGVSEGDYIGTVNDSKFLKIDGDDYVIKETGIRFMDSFVRNNKPEINISNLAISGGPRGQEITGLTLMNNGNASALDLQCFIHAKDIKPIKIASIEKIDPREKSESSLGFNYSNTPFSMKSLEKIEIFCEYKNKDGFEFISKKPLNQKSRDDGKYNISQEIR